MNEFKKFYLWGMNAKFYMGIYFAAIVFFCGIVTAIMGGDSLPLLVLLEMFGVAIVAGFSQTWLVPDSLDFSRSILCARSLCWMLLSAALTVAVSIWGGWFAGLPAWCPWLLGLLMLGGFTAMLIGRKFEQEADTVRLNDHLKRLQKD